MSDRRPPRHPLPASRLARALLPLLLLLAAPATARAQTTEKLNTNEAKRNREMGLAMLSEIKDTLKEHYYDPNYRGIDLNTRFKAAEERIKTLNYNWQVYRVLAQVLLDFNDSHTRLILPPRTDYFEYGFAVQMIGHDCFITSVKKGSDAERQGLRVGDQILNIGKFTPTRENLWKIMYLLYRLDPVDTVDLKIRDLAGAERQLTVKARTMTQKERREELKKRKEKKEGLKKRKDDEKWEPFKCQEVSRELIACKLHTFAVQNNEIDRMMKQVAPYKKFILDLRGNGGGRVVAELHLISQLFGHDVKVAEVVTRKKREARWAQGRGNKAYKGELVVLVDSETASAAEITARVVQIERRGKIVGDLSKGAVMTSVRAPLFGRLSVFTNFHVTFTGMSVTIADVIMSDGSRLEGKGVVPDYPVGPSPQGLAQRTDPVLAFAAGLLGAELTPQKAGQFYFITEKPEDDEEATEEGGSN